MAVCGHQVAGWHTGALLALAATKAWVAKAVGAGEPHWYPMEGHILRYLCWMPPVGRTRAKWLQAQVSQGCAQQLSLPLVATKAGLAKAAGAGGLQWHPSEVPWWLCVCLMQLPMCQMPSLVLPVLLWRSLGKFWRGNLLVLFSSPKRFIFDRSLVIIKMKLQRHCLSLL